MIVILFVYAVYVALNTFPKPIVRFIEYMYIYLCMEIAGKTEASKYLVHYLVNANNYDHGGKSHDLRDMILNSTIVLEAFGNAVTVQNHNSSRFGKYLKLNYSIKNELISTSTETFLLEKSRVVKLGKGERNYHIFYRLVYGLQVMFPDLSAQLCLTNISDFRILHNSDSDMNIDGSVEAREFSRLYDAMLDVRCKESDLKQLWTILAAILHLGNVDFISSSSDNLLHMQCTSTTTSNISEMLGLAEDELDRALATHIISTRGGTSVKVKLLNVIEVNNNIQGLIKRLYQSVFSWILQSINQYDDDREIQLQSEKFIGILDIFGFGKSLQTFIDCRFLSLELCLWFLPIERWTAPRHCSRQCIDARVPWGSPQA